MENYSNQLSQKIYFIRGQQVMLDSDLADLYGVETKIFNRAVKRNLDRFPCDFMFRLTNQEVAILKCQIGASSFDGWGGRRKLPLVFTEQGVAMLSGVLTSKTAAQVTGYPRSLFDLADSLLAINSLSSRTSSQSKIMRSTLFISESYRQLLVCDDGIHAIAPIN